MANMQCLIATLLLLSLMHAGDALQCWECTSDQYGNCADHFNTTRFPRTSLIYNINNNIPRLSNCDNPNPACMKMVEVDKTNERTTYTRGCHSLADDENVGFCLNKNIDGRRANVDFCGYCDKYECNGAQGLPKSVFWTGLVPISLALVLHK